jgi:pimeloyl-ACP methyl ester carboxylesterase
VNAAATTHVIHPGAFVPNPVLIKGEGRPLVYLHGPFGQEWLGFLDDLSIGRTVYAPAHAGSVDVADLDQLDSVSDLVLYYDDLFRKLDLNGFDLVGHSFGGMVAAEYAATYPERVRKLVLIDAMGLWDQDHPVEDHLLASPQRRIGLQFYDADSDVVAEYLTKPEDPQVAQDAFMRQFLALASTSHFIHPIPERGLRKRLRRIAAPTLVLWGEEDRLTPPVYAGEFAAAIGDARVAMVASAGHAPQLEKREEVSRLVKSFLSYP